MNNWFVETGTFAGDGVNYALKAGFKNISSVELDIDNYRKVCSRFHNVKNIFLYHGESEVVLWEMIKYIKEPITFWLDAHYSGSGNDPSIGEYKTAKGRSFTSLISELLTIKNHSIKTHTILIDDKRDFGKINMDYITEKEVRRLLLAINPEYNIFYETGSDENVIFKDDVLVATLK
ncbi:MAG: hypothetical protein RBR32_01740 [Bacteroidales bacterium]|nr:hypothetical protein [Bacteroidales bacterium]